MHKTGRNNTYLQRVVLTNQSLTHFPASLKTIFPYLRHIILSFNSIDRITNDHLSPFEMLNDLKMDHNQITYLDGNLFNGLASLILVDFSYNNIMYIGSDIKLPTRANFRNNPCINLEFYGANAGGDKRNFFVSHVQSQCVAVQPMTRQSSDISEDRNVMEKSTIIIDRTAEKEPEPITEEPSVNERPPKMGETLNCGFARLAGHEVSERCRQIFELNPKFLAHLENLPEFKADFNRGNQENV